MNKPSPKYDKEIIEMYETMSIRQISDYLGFSYGWVHSRLKLHNIKMRPASRGVKGFTVKLNPFVIKRHAFMYYRLNMSLDQIAEYEGVRRSTIAYRLEKAGYKIKPATSRKQFTDRQFEILIKNRDAKKTRYVSR